jgi:hypothetical protein
MSRRKKPRVQDSKELAYYDTEIPKHRKRVDDSRAAVEKKRAEIDTKRAAIANISDEIDKKRLETLKALIESYRQSLIANLPSDRKAETLNALAWLQATNPAPELSNGAQALDLVDPASESARTREQQRLDLYRQGQSTEVG